MIDIGNVIGRLTIIDKHQTPKKTSTHLKFLCKCACGNEKWIRYCNLQTKNTLSCGCLRKEPRPDKQKGRAEAIRSKFNYYKRNAKNRNYEWTLSYEEFKILVNNECHYCGHAGRTLLKSRWTGKTFDRVNGIDRINNSIGYNTQNSISCCEICNRAKGTLSLGDFRSWLQEAYGHSFYK